jgi:hypothetical protein
MRAAALRWFSMLVSKQDGANLCLLDCVPPLANATGRT